MLDVDTWLQEKGVVEEADIKAVKTFSGYTFYVIEADTATNDPETQKKKQWLERCTAAEKELRDLLKKAEEKRNAFVKESFADKTPIDINAVLQLAKEWIIKYGHIEYISNQELGKLVIPEYETCQKDYAEDRKKFKTQHGRKDLAEFKSSY